MLVNLVLLVKVVGFFMICGCVVFAALERFTDILSMTLSFPLIQMSIFQFYTLGHFSSYLVLLHTIE